MSVFLDGNMPWGKMTHAVELDGSGLYDVHVLLHLFQCCLCA
jgi:hypothetical protein